MFLSRLRALILLSSDLAPGWVHFQSIPIYWTSSFQRPRTAALSRVNIGHGPGAFCRKWNVRILTYRILPHVSFFAPILAWSFKKVSLPKRDFYERSYLIFIGCKSCRYQGHYQPYKQRKNRLKGEARLRPRVRNRPPTGGLTVELSPRRALQ